MIAAGIGLTYLFPHAMISPGELTAAHQDLNEKCTSCHEMFTGISDRKCISCHKLSDIGKDSPALATPGEKLQFHEQLTTQQCTACHSDHNGPRPDPPMKNFSHEILPSDILANCQRCHGLPGDSLHNQITLTCANCHNTKGWKSNVTFDHDMIRTVAKTNCVACHRKPTDEFHRQLEQNCDKCHATSQWKPSTFDHSEYFRLDADHDVTCNTCHRNNNFEVFTCYGCHEHSESGLKEEHNEHGIYNFSNCISCHKSSDEDDIRMDGRENRINGGDLERTKKYLESQRDNRKKDHDD